MGKASRDKGAKGEREVVNQLADAFGDLVEIEVERLLSQSRDAGPDVELRWPDGGFGQAKWFFEVKRRRTHPGRGEMEGWYSGLLRWHVQEFGETADMRDIFVAYRIDNGKWRLIYMHTDAILVDVSFADWVALIRRHLRQRIRDDARADIRERKAAAMRGATS